MSLHVWANHKPHAHTYMHTHICTHTYMHTHMHTHTHTHMHTHMHTNTHTHSSVCTVCMHTTWRAEITYMESEAVYIVDSTKETRLCLKPAKPREWSVCVVSTHYQPITPSHCPKYIPTRTGVHDQHCSFP